MLEVGKMQEFGAQLKKYRVDLAAIQETRWRIEGQIDHKDYTMLYSGDVKQGRNGMAFIVMNKWRSSILEYKPSRRISYIRIKAKPYNLSLVNVYAYTEEAKEEKEKWYEEINKICEQTPKHDTLIVLGDFNARIGKESYLKDVAEKFTMHEKTHNNGQMLSTLAAEQGLILVSTKFQRRKEEKITWKIPGKDDGTQIDHVLVNRKRHSAVRYAKTQRTPNVDSDHYKVTAVLNQKVQKRKKMSGQRKWNTQELENP